MFLNETKIANSLLTQLLAVKQVQLDKYPLSTQQTLVKMINIQKSGEKNLIIPKDQIEQLSVILSLCNIMTYVKLCIKRYKRQLTFF